MSSTVQNSLYVGINLEDILYGVELVLYFQTMHALLSRKRRRTKVDVFYAIFSTGMLLCATIWVSTQAVLGEKVWVEDTGYPGGTSASWNAHIGDWYVDLGSAVAFLLQLMTDALMIYRCQLIWDGPRVIIIPAILWIGTFVLGILVIYTLSGTPNYLTPLGLQFGTAYYSMAVGQTALLTTMICYRMVTHGRSVRRYLGEDYATVYYTMLAVIVESVLPYTLSGVAFVVVLGLSLDTPNSTGIAFMSVYNMMMCISPQMMILRVASGLSWSETTGKALPSTLRFTHPGVGTGTATEPRRAEEGVVAVTFEAAVPEKAHKREDN